LGLALRGTTAGTVTAATTTVVGVGSFSILHTAWSIAVSGSASSERTSHPHGQQESPGRGRAEIDRSPPRTWVTAHWFATVPVFQIAKPRRMCGMHRGRFAEVARPLEGGRARHFNRKPLRFQRRVRRAVGAVAVRPIKRGRQHRPYTDVQRAARGVGEFLGIVRCGCGAGSVSTS
jgi:hypothetical protein